MKNEHSRSLGKTSAPQVNLYALSAMLEANCALLSVVDIAKTNAKFGPRMKIRFTTKIVIRRKDNKTFSLKQVPGVSEGEDVEVLIIVDITDSLQ
jgi:hypothetical protein